MYQLGLSTTGLPATVQETKLASASGNLKWHLFFNKITKQSLQRGVVSLFLHVTVYNKTKDWLTLQAGDNK